MSEPTYTQAELREFRRLVEKAESLQQNDRIHARMEQPKFIAKHGKEKCDAMYEVLMKELKPKQPTTPEEYREARRRANVPMTREQFLAQTHRLAKARRASEGGDAT